MREICSSGIEIFAFYFLPSRVDGEINVFLFKISEITTCIRRATQYTALHKYSESTSVSKPLTCRRSHLPLCSRFLEVPNKLTKSSIFCLKKASGGKRTQLDWQPTRKTIHQNIFTQEETCRTRHIWLFTKQILPLFLPWWFFCLDGWVWGFRWVIFFLSSLLR